MHRRQLHQDKCQTRLKEIMPEEVFRAVSRHLVRAAHRAERGFHSSEEEEDAITGDLFGSLRHDWTSAR
jgi:hypothetical protein